MDLHDAMKQLEIIAYVLHGQSEHDRQVVPGVIADMADEASGPRWIMTVLASFAHARTVR
ncbi:hypothetical protein ACQEU3_43090 [Spirillospora sp. CA-253888]